MNEVKKAKGDFIELSVEDFNKLLMCARKCKDDFFIMKNLLAMKPLKDSAKDCIDRMEFREPIFKILEKYKNYKL
jgi:hypothetical protein